MYSLKFSDLRLFREIVHLKSVTKGAEECGVTQSAASQHLKELERRFQMPLLNRRPMRLTAAGTAYLDFCQQVLRQHEELQAVVARLGAEPRHCVRFVAIYSLRLPELNRLQEEFRQRYPAAELTVDYMRPERIYEAIRDGQADLGLVSYPKASRDVVAIPWREEEMVLAVAPAHRFAKMPSVHPMALAGEPFVAFDEDLPIQRHLDRFLREQKVTVKKILHLDNMDSVREAVALSQGISILPKPVVKSWVEIGRLVAIPLVPRSLRRPLGIVHSSRAPLAAPAQAFLDLLLENALRRG
ncbi:MAG: LysR family transcriptional regulator [Acidobacteria bacterium]|nr:LysR family transcriptional regulator [Acidobacteriota bacterium]